MTQSLGGCDPDVIPLKINCEGVVVRRGRIYSNVRYIAVGIAHIHLRSTALEVWPIHCPVGSVVVRQALVSAEPCPVTVERFHLIGEVAGQAAVFAEEVVPVASV